MVISKAFEKFEYLTLLEILSCHGKKETAY